MESVRPLLLLVVTAACFSWTSAQSSNYCVNPVANDTGVCFCDVTSYCDVDCCCDPQCAAADIQLFSICADQYNLNTSCTCFSSGSMLNNNTLLLGGQQSYAVSGSSCFYQTTYSTLVSTLNTYIAPQFSTCFQLTSNVSAAYQMSAVGGNLVYTNYATRYISGQRLLVVYGSPPTGVGYYPGYDAVGYLPLPKPIGGQYGSDCADNNAASYLNSESWTCTRQILDIAGACANLAAIKASSYYNNMWLVNNASAPVWVMSSQSYADAVINFQSPGNSFLLSIPTTANTLSSVQYVSISPSVTYATGACPSSTSTTSPPSPTGNSSFCDCVVQSVSYQITVASGVISSASVAFVIGSLSSTVFQQSFSISYNNMQTQTNSPLQKSGSPGYTLGSPVLGLYNSNVYSSTTNSSWVTSQNCITSLATGTVCPVRVLAAPAAYDCSSCLTNPSQCAQSLQFGMNYRSGCAFAVNSSNFSTVCTALKNQALYLLAALPYPSNGNSNVTAFSSYVPSFGVFGDLSSTISTFNNMSTWQQTTVYQQSGAAGDTYRNTTFTCTNLTRSLSIQVMYINTGSIANPTPVIVGLAYQFGQQETLTYNFGIQNDPVQYIEMKLSASFVNASTSNTLSKAGIPQNAPVQPNWSDFFYLLYVDKFVTQILGGW